MKMFARWPLCVICGVWRLDIETTYSAHNQYDMLPLYVVMIVREDTNTASQPAEVGDTDMRSVRRSNGSSRAKQQRDARALRPSLLVALAATVYGVNDDDTETVNAHTCSRHLCIY